MMYSHRAKTNMTNQLKAQLGFYLKDLEHERDSLRKAKSMISQHERGVKKTLTDIENITIRIKRRQKNGEIYKIL